MKKDKLKLIETYIYAKTLNLISSTPLNVEQNEIANFIKNANNLSLQLLGACENKIIENKLNDYSFLELKNELNSAQVSKNILNNYLKICEMIKKYDTYLSFVSWSIK